MKKCELCKMPARLYCESDQASLCARCDLRVHEANFLVARHSRTLLCKTCQSPTPWEASGARLGNTVTECENCVERRDEREGVMEALGDDDVLDDGYSDIGSGSECDEMSGSDGEEEGENQIVHWSYTPSSPPPPAASSSSNDESSSSSSFCASRRLSAKRMRHLDTDRRFQISQNDLVGSSSAWSTTSALSPKSQRVAEASGTPLNSSPINTVIRRFSS